MRLIAEKLSAIRGGEQVLRDVSFRVCAGESLVVTGPNGSGKSTLLRLLSGLLQASSGAIWIEDGEPGASLASACHYLGHDNAMKASLTVAENLVFWQRFLGPSAISVDDALEAVGLGAIGRLPFGYLSTGQRRRAAIARLLVSTRRIWLLDEPTAGLDTASERNFAALMAGHVGDGGLLVAATHLPLGIEGAKTLRLVAT